MRKIELLKLIQYPTLLILLFTLMGCSTGLKKIERHPFEIDHSITGYDLVSDGYRWMPGVDVVLLGKKTKDTLDYYQTEFPTENTLYQDGDMTFLELEEEEIIQIPDTQVTEVKEEMAPLDMPDSMYNRIWWNNDPNYKEGFRKGSPINRYFYLTLTKDGLDQFMDKMDSTKYRLSRGVNVHDNYVDEFLILNLHSKDTFFCSVEALENGKFRFLSYCSVGK
ncbi:hypothetical protein KFE98_16220 [bacterium SCSIO 12741]|nr:hypothetical protein KFE98_16220 [bacterium SCSIO 12741]